MLTEVASYALDILLRFACLKFDTIKGENTIDRIWECLFQVGMDDPQFPYSFYYMANKCGACVTPGKWLTYHGEGEVQSTVAYLHCAETVRGVVFRHLEEYAQGASA